MIFRELHVHFSKSWFIIDITFVPHRQLPSINIPVEDNIGFVRSRNPAIINLFSRLNIKRDFSFCYVNITCLFLQLPTKQTVSRYPVTFLLLPRSKCFYPSAAIAFVTSVDVFLLAVFLLQFQLQYCKNLLLVLTLSIADIYIYLYSRSFNQDFHELSRVSNS